MRIKDVLKGKRDVITIGFQEKVKTAHELLIKNNISALPVLDEDRRIMGIISERDILREFHSHFDDLDSRHVGDAMTKELLVGLENDDLDYVMNIMTRNNIRHVPIMSGKDLVGIISIRDVVKGLMHKVESENRYLKDYIEGKFEGYM